MMTLVGPMTPGTSIVRGNILRRYGLVTRILFGLASSTEVIGHWEYPRSRRGPLVRLLRGECEH